VTRWTHGWLLILVAIGLIALAVNLAGCTRHPEPVLFPVLEPCDDGLVCIPV
jgi:hypothetical protein